MGALEGLSVVQLGETIAAPVLGMLLADQGASVVAVESPAGSPVPGPGPAIWARGKRRRLLDLRDADARDELTALLDAADVVIDGFPPGRLARFGVTVERPADQVWCALPGFARSPSQAQAWEGVIGAQTGLYNPPVGSRPGFTSIPVASMLAAFLGANAVITALMARQRDGRGQRVEVPLFGAALLAQELTALLTLDPPKSWHTLQWAASPLLAPWRTPDGWVYVHAGQPAHLAALLDALERVDRDAIAALRTRLSEQTLADPTRPRSLGEANAIRAVFQSIFAQKHATEWEAELAHLCVVAVRSGAAWVDHPQPRATGEVVVRDDPERGALAQPGVQVRLDAAPGEAGARETLSGKTGRLAAGWRRRSQWMQEATPADASAPLSGVMVYDLTQVIAGPVAARTLAELGATVYRIENPKLVAGWVDAFHVAFNAGKHSLSVDLSTESGRAALWKAMHAVPPDVVIHNFRPGVAERLGLGKETLKQAFSNVVVTELSAYGSTGPWAERPGWEQTAQAVTGMQLAAGGSRGPDLLPLPVNDLGTGLMGSFGTLLALLHRARTGEASGVQTWLTATATLLQSASLFDPNRARWSSADGPGATGTGPLHRWVRAKDGWMFLAAPGREASVRAIEGVEGPLDQAFAGQPVHEWQERARAAGVASVVTFAAQGTLRDALGDHALRERHDGLGEVTIVHPLWTFSRSTTVALRPVSARGADHVDHLVSDGVLHDRPSAALPTARWVGAQARWAGFLLWSRLARAMQA